MYYVNNTPKTIIVNDKCNKILYLSNKHTHEISGHRTGNERRQTR